MKLAQIHIEAARNSTDDFNLFHDKAKWQRVRNNPFGGPIALGFQLECLIEYQLHRHRVEHDEYRYIEENELCFSNYRFAFADAVRPGVEISVDIRKSRQGTQGEPALANRVVLKADGRPALVGHKRETRRPTALPDADLHGLPPLHTLPDRSYVEGGEWFLKRKFMNVGNAKNFLSGSLAEQSEYFDELEGKIRFPEVFPASLISCALLERALIEGHDFEAAPMVYTSHHISIDRLRLRRLRSNDRLHVLVRKPKPLAPEGGLRGAGVTQMLYECVGLTDGGHVLYQAEIALASLGQLIGAATRAA